jgi:type II secretory pathway pseudopilin PulG
MIKRLTTSGETIVEVLIVMLILTSVMASAFVITTHTLNQDQGSQERSEAAGYAQSQIEFLNSAIGDGTITSVTPLPTNFCFMPDGTRTTVTIITSLPLGCPPTPSSRYSSYISIDPANNAFVETVKWDNATGSGQDNIKLVYRPHFLSIAQFKHEVTA